MRNFFFITMFVFLLFSSTTLAQPLAFEESRPDNASGVLKPDLYDIKQDDRFNNYITADNELARIIERRVTEVATQLKIITAILAAIGTAFAGVIVTHIWSKGKNR